MPFGFAGQDPSMCYSTDGTPVTNFSVATRQVVSKDRISDCLTGWEMSLNGHLRLGTDHPSTELTRACGKVQAGQALVPGHGLAPAIRAGL
jgi:hypothetical protein